MRLTFIGADHEVTGSCHVIETAERTILVDYGMEQGINLYENAPLPVSPEKIDYVFLTHAHIDHSGNLPYLWARGFRGKIFATQATRELCEIMLRDSAGIQEFEAEWRNRKGKRKGDPEYVPYYTLDDAVNVLKLFVECDYGKIYEPEPGIRLRFNDIGHLLGSSAIEAWFTEEDETVKMVFSGDIGNKNQPILKNPGSIEEADYILIESTYGDRSHGPRIDYVKELAGVLEETFARGGNVVIPSFAVGRTQEMLYFIRQVKEKGLVGTYPDFEVYVDSPMALAATEVFKKNYLGCYNEEASELVGKGINPLEFPGLRLAATTDESKAINFDERPKVIISASGMCDAGRIKHHLKHNLWRPECTILFVGYQSQGTLGRKIVDGAKSVKLFTEEITVNARIQVLPGTSGHADREGLLEWASGFSRKPKKCFVVHGEDRVTDVFAELLGEKLGWDAAAPYSGAVYDLRKDCFEVLTEGIPFVKKDAEGRPVQTDGTPRTPYVRLLDTEKRLLSLIHECRGMSNKDLAKFADQLDALIGKWAR
ncbi:MAG: MBL fold metallo-hydrolase [Lachnospiraceae bacterium]|nr:MBL fold metallo-hydrolase [Lachnospiraceae bacterium]